MQTAAGTSTFSRQASKLLDHDPKRALIDFLAANPESGDEIPGRGGVRKLRFAASGRGKRGGARAIQYLDETMPGHAPLVYAKSATTDMNSAEKRSVAALALS